MKHIVMYDNDNPFLWINKDRSFMEGGVWPELSPGKGVSPKREVKQYRGFTTENDTKCHP
jgi:hypothetical protein